MFDDVFNIIEMKMYIVVIISWFEKYSWVKLLCIY